jgi:hypothetical protein
MKRFATEPEFVFGRTRSPVREFFKPKLDVEELSEDPRYMVVGEYEESP